MQALNFPFTAVAGQPLFKLALVLAAINPAIGGVLVSGPRGSAKSTLARGLADIVPPNRNGKAHAFVTLPLGATEEMLLGTLNLQRVMQERRVEFQHGLLSRADGGVLYVDEVNLLQDNLVDQLLDVSASGVNVVERDGVSHSHSAQFILLGTMNPDEGELRPQLQDRFGLSVELNNTYSIDERVAIVRLREAFDSAPEAFLNAYKGAQQDLSQSIQNARLLLPDVNCDDILRRQIAERCQAACVDGLRADLVWYRAAAAHAAFHKQRDVQEANIDAVEELVLAHRRNQLPENVRQPPSPPSQQAFSRPPARGDGHPSQPPGACSDGDWGSMAPVHQKTLASAVTFSLQQLKQSGGRALAEKTWQSKNKGNISGGRKTGSQKSTRVDWFSSLAGSAGRWPPNFLRFRRGRFGQPVLNLVLLDTSGSTLQNQLFAKAKAAVLHIAEQAYLDRERLTILGFGNQKVEVLLPGNRAPKSLRRLLDTIPAAGGTPFRQMLEQALRYQEQQRSRMAGLALRTYLLTDGRITQRFEDKHLLGDVAVIDIEQSTIKRGKGRQIARALCADYFSLSALTTQPV